jgi:hypothetical protein
LDGVGQELVGMVEVDHALLDLGEFGADHRLSARLVLLELGDLGQGQPGLLAFAQQDDPLRGLRRIAALPALAFGRGEQAVPFPKPDGRGGHSGDLGEAADGDAHALLLFLLLLFLLLLFLLLLFLLLLFLLLLFLVPSRRLT